MYVTTVKDSREAHTTHQPTSQPVSQSATHPPIEQSIQLIHPSIHQTNTILLIEKVAEIEKMKAN